MRRHATERYSPYQRPTADEERYNAYGRAAAAPGPASLALRPAGDDRYGGYQAPGYDAQSNPYSQPAQFNAKPSAYSQQSPYEAPQARAPPAPYAAPSRAAPAAPAAPALSQLDLAQLYAAYAAQAQQFAGFAPPAAAAPAPDGGHAAPLPPNAFKVGKETEVKKLAGKIANSVRTDNVCDVVARGIAINVAVKAIAMACAFLKQDNSTLTCGPYHANDGDNHTGRSVIFHCMKVALPADTNQDPLLVKISQKSQPSRVGGYIASKVRSGKTNVVVQCVGAYAMQHAVNSLVLARRYLKLDAVTGKPKLDFSITPGFVTIMQGEEKHSAMNFAVIL